MEILNKGYIQYMKDNVEVLGQHYAETEDELHLVDREVTRSLRAFTEKLYNTLTTEVEVIFVDYEPYNYLKDGAVEMMKDYEQGFIKVPTLGDDSEIFEEFNLMFRASHDIVHCIMNKSFSYEDEFDTFLYTARMFRIWNPDLYQAEEEQAIRVLRSEIIYQSAFKNSEAENIIDQKIILSDPS